MHVFLLQKKKKRQKVLPKSENSVNCCSTGTGLACICDTLKSYETKCSSYISNNFGEVHKCINLRRKIRHIHKVHLSIHQNAYHYIFSWGEKFKSSQVFLHANSLENVVLGKVTFACSEASVAYFFLLLNLSTSHQS